jgi:arginyl-tRNA synthetase
MIAEYPEVVQEARLTLEPCNVVSYLMSLSRAVSTAVDRLWVAGQPAEIAAARLALYRAARHALGNGLVLLGLVPLERM